jgi:hypothetical protein
MVNPSDTCRMCDQTGLKHETQAVAVKPGIGLFGLWQYCVRISEKAQLVSVHTPYTVALFNFHTIEML